METISYQKEVTASKDHTCNFCSSKIASGSTYLKSTHKYDGEIYDWKTHKRCSDIAIKLKMYDECPDEGLTGDDFMELIHSEYIHLLSSHFEEREIVKYSDIIQQLRKVNFEDKLNYVIRHHDKSK